MNKRITVRAQSLLPYDGFGLYVFGTDLETRKRHAIKPIEFEDEPIPATWLPGADIAMEDSEIQQMMDDLWVAGMRPSKRLFEQTPLDHMEEEVRWTRGIIERLLPKQ
jgi:hypothetical protein